MGTRDLLPPEASTRRALSRTLTTLFQAHGYALVTTPPFERIDVLERAGTLAPNEVLTFVDGDTGEVAVLRPDITPQIARLVATRLRDRPPPYRLAYEGHVLRRHRGRARLQRQIAQCGLECIGLPGAVADAEIVEIAVRALERTGLEDFTIELALVPLARRLLDRVPDAQRNDATDALGQKDRVRLSRALAHTDAATARTLDTLGQLYGDASVLRDAKRALRGNADLQVELDALSSLVGTLRARGLGGRLALDLGEVRGFGYYTGPSFSILAPGPGEPLGGGGRYDGLLARFGRALRGAGFGLDLDHVAWALTHAGRGAPWPSDLDVAIASSEPNDAARSAATELRMSGLRVSVLGAEAEGPEPRTDALAWAAAWSVPFVLELRSHPRGRGAELVLTEVEGGVRRIIPDVDAARAAIQEHALGRVRQRPGPAPGRTGAARSAKRSP